MQLSCSAAPHAEQSLRDAHQCSSRLLSIPICICSNQSRQHAVLARLHVEGTAQSAYRKALWCPSSKPGICIDPALTGTCCTCCHQSLPLRNSALKCLACAAGMWRTAGEAAGIAPIPPSVHRGPMAPPSIMAMLLPQTVNSNPLLLQPFNLMSALLWMLFRREMSPFSLPPWCFTGRVTFVEQTTCVPQVVERGSPVLSKALACLTP